MTIDTRKHPTSGVGPDSPPLGAHPMAAIDVVPITITPDLHLTIGTSPRVGDPFAGEWALPGVLLKPQEALDAAADRAMISKAEIRPEDMLYKAQIGAFDTPERDPREPVISIAYLIVCRYVSGPRIRWQEQPAGLPFDHDIIIARAREAAQVRWISDLAFTRALTGSEFNMGDAAQIGESLTGILRRPSNLTRTLLSTEKILRGTTSPSRGVGRPATIWQWK